MSRLLINRAFAGQRVTGQQRYAHEIASRLDADAIEPTGIWRRSAVLTWLWVLVVLPWRHRDATLVSLTSRAPLWRRRHLLVVHDLFVITNPEWFSRRYVWTHAPVLRAQIRWASAVVAVSEPVAEQVRRLRCGVVAVGPNAPSAVFREDASGSPTHGLTPGSYFLAVGSRDPRKNLDRLAQAYGLLQVELRRRHPLVLVGGSSAIYADSGQEWPEGTVDMGYVDDARLRDLYRDARTVVFVSLAEGFGLPLVEAAAAGAPSLLVSEIPVFRWICGRQGRYLDPRSVDSIAAGLRSEIDDHQIGRLDITRFTWDESARVVQQTARLVSGAEPTRELS